LLSQTANADRRRVFNTGITRDVARCGPDKLHKFGVSAHPVAITSDMLRKIMKDNGRRNNDKDI